MPSMPPTARYPGQRSRDEERRDYDARRRETQHWRRWYSLAAWKRRRNYQLAVEPYCRKCKEEGVTTPATVADHVEPHRGDAEKFWRGDLQSLCEPCHNGVKQAEERAASTGPEGRRG